MKKIILIGIVCFSILQFIYGVYIHNISSFDHYTTLYKNTAFLYMIMAILLFKKNIIRRIIRRINIALAIITLVFYSWGYFDLLIMRGFITNWHNSFLLMIFSFHAPIIFFNLFIIFFLTRKKIKAEFNN